MAGCSVMMDGASSSAASAVSTGGRWALSSAMRSRASSSNDLLDDQVDIALAFAFDPSPLRLELLHAWMSNSLPNAVAPHCNCERGLRSTAGPSILRACRSTRPSRRRANRLGGSSSASSLRLEFVTKLVAARAPPSPAFEGYG